MRSTRYAIGVAVCFGIILAHSVTQAPNWSAFRAALPDKATAVGTGVPVTNIEAIHFLKKENLYDSLAEAYQAARYRAEPNTHPAVRGQSVVYHASNPAHGLDAYFANDAVRVTAGESGSDRWSWVVRLTAYGYGDSLQPAQSVNATANENRIEYSRGFLTEWYVNDRRGVEQGFTLAKPPAASTAGSLMVTMAVDTDLQMRPDRDAKKVAYVDSGNRIRLHYGNLRAWDASGKDLPATIEAGNREITLRIDDSAATYPVTVDPLIYTETKLTASDVKAGARLGISIAISRDGATVVVGAPEGYYGTLGSAYVFVRIGGVWSQQQKLTASDAQGNQRFGASVAIDGDTIVVGAPHGVYPFFAPGSAYVFVRSGGVWTEQQKLKPIDSADYDAFGWSVAISGDTIVVGATDFNMSAPKWPPGSAYIFRLTGFVYIQEAKLTPSDGMLQDVFGFSVAISGDGTTVVVGAENGDSPAVADSGAAYVFQRTGIFWTQEAKLTASDAASNHQFGTSIGISGGTIVVGAPGAIYIFVPISGSWSQLQELTTLPEDVLGYSVAINGDTIVAGASGAAYVFQNSAIGWMLGARLTASDGGGLVGAVSLSGDTNTIAVGAPNVNAYTGAAYVYTKVLDRTPPVTTLRLAGPAGSNGWYLGTVVATASASDPDNAPAQLTPFHAIDGGSAQMYAAPFTLSGDGVHHVSYWSIDPAGNEEAHRLIEVKIDSTRPAVTVSATPSSLWRSDGKMVPVTVSGTMTDSGSGIDPASIRFAVNDSYGRMQPSGNVSVGPNGSYAFTVSLEASRDGNDKSGRTYTLSISVGDLAGNTGSGSAIVTVPHNKNQ